MKLIIAGGRDYILTNKDFERLDDIKAMHILDPNNHEPIEFVLSGCAKGADTCGQLWASHRGVPVKLFPADWNKYGKRAGYLRNEAMARNATHLALFKGGKGTRHMYNIARARGLTIYNFSLINLAEETKKQKETT